LLLGLAGMTVAVTQTAGSGFLLLETPSTTGQAGSAESKPTSTAGSQTVSFGTTVLGNWVMLGDAIVSPSIPDLPLGVLPLVLAIPVLYFLLRRKSVSLRNLPARTSSL
jgi:hypothetical protein